MYPMPEGECLGRQTFQFALYPHTGDHVTGHVHAIADIAVLGPYSILGQALPGDLLQGPLVQVVPPTVRVTALKPADAAEALVLRLLNDSDKPVDATVGIGLPAGEIQEADLLEQPLSAGRPIARKDNTLTLPMRPYEFVTLLLAR